MSWLVSIASSARKNLKRFPLRSREKILLSLEEFIFNPYAGDIEKIKGEDNTWRRRVGDYRIIYDVNPKKNLVEVRIIKRRSSNTY